jgi:hypothetical protein
MFHECIRSNKLVHMMKILRPIFFAMGAIGTLAVVSLWAKDDPAPSGNAQGSPVYGVRLPEGYREWQVISVAHEAGNNNDIRAILGNKIAVKAAQERTLPYPDGAIIARLAYEYVASERNNTIFGREQSFVAGNPTNVQISVKDSKRFPKTAGWGYGQFENGKPNPSEKIVSSCFACHAKLPASADFVFTTYSK